MRVILWKVLWGSGGGSPVIKKLTSVRLAGAWLRLATTEQPNGKIVFAMEVINNSEWAGMAEGKFLKLETDTSISNLLYTWHFSAFP